MSDQTVEIFPIVQQTLADALGVDEFEVKPESSLVEDLGAESIDFLDVLFRLEKKFSINIPREELFPEDILASAEYVQDGKISAEGVKLLKERMPFADVSALEVDPQINNFGNLITVQAICNYVASRTS